MLRNATVISFFTRESIIKYEFWC